MLNDIIQKVSEKVGISNEQATMAVNTVIGILKEKLPAPLSSQIDSLLSGGTSAAGGALDSAKNLVGGLFNKK